MTTRGSAISRLVLATATMLAALPVAATGHAAALPSPAMNSRRLV
jgi:hypothetical protein